MSTSQEVDALVRSSFVVRDTYARGDEGSAEYSVTYDAATSPTAFRELYRKLSPLGYTPRLIGSQEDASILVTKNVEPQKPSSRTPVFLALISAVSIIVTGWGVGLISSQEAGNSNVLLTGASFVLGVLGVLIARDVAHRVVARRKGLSTLQYYLPNIPLFVPIPVLYYLPSFGSITFLRAPPIDRNSLFDFYFVGAVVGVVVALGVALVGAPSAGVFAPTPSGSVTSNLSLLQTLAIAIGGNSLSQVAPAGESLLLSPLEIAAWVGFLISFFSLVPAALFDGGRMSTLVLGERGSRITTMVTAVLLIIIDVPNYWVLFLLIFLLAAIQPSNETLDSVTKISRSRKLMFLFAMLLLFLCGPIPQTLLGIPIV